MANFPKSLFKTVAVISVLSAVVLVTYKIIQARSVKPLCKDCNVIIVSLDTLGSNHLPCYGYSRNTAPNLCAFAKENILFKNTYANATWTLPSHVSIFTGLYPYTHGVNIANDSLSHNLPFLPEILQQAGYTTIFAGPYKDPTFNRDLVYNRGIDRYYYEWEKTWPQLLEDFRLRVNSGKKSFLFLHTYTVHAPYFTEDKPLLFAAEKIEKIPTKESEVYGVFTDELFKYLAEQIPIDIENGKFNDKEAIVYKDLLSYLIQHEGDYESIKQYVLNMPDRTGYLWAYLTSVNYFQRIDTSNPRDIDFIEALYDQKIVDLDTEISEVISFIQKEGIADNTILIFTSDHGEEFMEHKQITHITLYDPNIRVPFIMYVPRIRSKEIATPVQSVDITPTLLEILGIETQSMFQGQSLIELLDGKRIADRLIVSDGNRLENRSLRLNDWKLFLNTEEGKLSPYALYNTTVDPNEMDNQLYTHQDIVKKILRMYRDNN